MSRTQRPKRAGVLGALGALVAALLVVVAVPAANGALPGDCTTTFTGSGNWATGGNWTNNVPGPSSVACIQGGKSATLSTGVVHVAKLHIDTLATLTVTNANLFVDTHEFSLWLGDVFVDHGTIGGTGLIHVHGTVHFSGGSVLTSVDGPVGTFWGGQGGTMDIPGDGSVFVDDGALSMRSSYGIGIFGKLVVDNDGFVTADWGTGTTVAGGRLELNGAGGYYQGSPVPGRSVGALVNAGTIAKTGGGTTSIIDAAYTAISGSTVEVDCCATLAFAGGQVVSGKVVAGMSLGTGACGAGTTSVCAGSVSPAIDPTAVTMQIPGSNPQTASVQLQELAVPPLTQDSKRIGQEIFAHADQLTPDAGNPATITLRLSDPDVMATPLASVQVAHTLDSGLQVQIPDCVTGTLPPGATACVVRPVQRTAENTIVTIKTTETSRWHLRRNLPGEPGDQTAPSAPQAAAAAITGGGAGVHLVWAEPANDGGAAVTSYRVLLDGKQVATTAGLAADVPNPGVGAHTLEVQAVNVIGNGAKAATAVTIKALSKPRQAVALRGAKGGKKTAGLRWKAPASVGGLALTDYQVVVVNKAGKVVAKKKVSAIKLKVMVTFKTTGKVRFKVRARNLDKYGPFSAWTDWVSPR